MGVRVLVVVPIDETDETLYGSLQLNANNRLLDSLERCTAWSQVCVSPDRPPRADRT